MNHRIVYLHGFASSPASRKARFFRERGEQAGWTVEVPDLAEGDFERLTISGQLEVIRRTVADRPASLVGSSMGGYLAALFAAQHPSAVDRLVLLAPAFGFSQLWTERLGPEKIAAWKQTGTMPVFHYAEMRELNLSYGLHLDSLEHEPNPAFAQPALLFHGIRDTVVPPSCAQKYASINPNVRLEFLESDHELIDVLPAIWDKAFPFLNSLEATLDE